jgi:hypothetical protein
MDGDKLYKHIDSLGKTQAEILTMTTFSKTKLYQLYKQASISMRDKAQLTKDFKLASDFFHDTEGGHKAPVLDFNFFSDYMELKERVVTLAERTAQYEARLQDKDKLIAILERQLNQETKRK